MPPPAWVGKARPYLLQAGLLGSVYAGVQVLGRLARTRVDPRLAELAPTAATTCPGLLECLTQLAALGRDAEWERVVRMCEEACVLSRKVHQSSAQLALSRHSSEILRHVRHLCRVDARECTDEHFRVLLACRDEVTPALQTHLDDLLHNHLLARR